MDINDLIEKIEIIVWIFPAIRNIKTDLRYYFILAAVANPAATAVYELFGIYPMFVGAVFRFLQLISLVGWSQDLIKNIRLCDSDIFSKGDLAQRIHNGRHIDRQWTVC